MVLIWLKWRDSTVWDWIEKKCSYGPAWPTYYHRYELAEDGFLVDHRQMLVKALLKDSRFEMIGFGNLAFPEQCRRSYSDRRCFKIRSTLFVCSNYKKQSFSFLSDWFKALRQGGIPMFPQSSLICDSALRFCASTLCHGLVSSICDSCCLIYQTTEKTLTDRHDCCTSCNCVLV